jgi:hypothetical protein
MGLHSKEHAHLRRQPTAGIGAWPPPNACRETLARRPLLDPMGESSGRGLGILLVCCSNRREPDMRPTGNPTPSTAALDYESTMIGALELSSKKWVFAVQLPGIKKHTRHVVEPNGPALMELIERLKERSVGAGRPIARVIITHEAGRDGFWLARFLERRGVEVHVMQSSSLPVDRRARRAKTDVIDAEMLLRTLMAWLRGEPRVCSMVPVPSEADEEARRAHREREDLIGARRSLLNKIDGILATLGIEDYQALRPTGVRDWPICASRMAPRLPCAAIRCCGGREAHWAGPRQFRARLPRQARAGISLSLGAGTIGPHVTGGGLGLPRHSVLRGANFLADSVPSVDPGRLKCDTRGSDYSLDI